MSAVFMCSKRFIIIIIIIIILRFYAVTLNSTLMNNADRENSQPLCVLCVCVWGGGGAERGLLNALREY